MVSILTKICTEEPEESALGKMVSKMMELEEKHASMSNWAKRFVYIVEGPVKKKRKTKKA